MILRLIASDKLFLSTSVNALSDTESEIRSWFLTELVVSTQLAIDYIDRLQQVSQVSLGKKSEYLLCHIY